MITYEIFKKHMTEVQALWDMKNKISDIVRDYNNKYLDMCEIWTPDLSDNVISLLETIIGDKDGWISYWAWELDFGRDYEDGMVTGADGIDIPLKTLEELWTFLVKEYGLNGEM